MDCTSAYNFAPRLRSNADVGLDEPGTRVRSNAVVTSSPPQQPVPLALRITPTSPTAAATHSCAAALLPPSPMAAGSTSGEIATPTTRHYSVALAHAVGNHSHGEVNAILNTPHEERRTVRVVLDSAARSNNALAIGAMDSSFRTENANDIRDAVETAIVHNSTSFVRTLLQTRARRYLDNDDLGRLITSANNKSRTDIASLLQEARGS